MNAPKFNPTQQATSSTDHLAYGSLFQWGRPADGHELRTCTSGTSCTEKYGTTASQASTVTPGSNQFIVSSASPYDWTSGDSDGSQRAAFWSRADGTGVCPIGFRIPTEAEVISLNFSSVGDAFSKISHPAAGVRPRTAYTTSFIGSNSSIWSSTPTGNLSKNLQMYASSATWSNSGRAEAFSVRCIQH